jgi:regulator of replication initiation timing
MRIWRLFLYGCIGFLWACPSSADFSWEQTVTMKENNKTVISTQKIFFTREIFSFDTDDGMRVVVNITANTITTVNDREKKYFTADIDQMEQKIAEIEKQTEQIIADTLKNLPENMRPEYEKMLREKLSSPDNKENIPRAKDYKPTGKTAIITGYNAMQYAARGDSGSVHEMWCTKDINLLEIKEFFAKLREMSFFKNVALDSGIFEIGFPLKIIKHTGSSTYSTEVTAINTQKIEDSIFSIPAGYTESEDVFSFGTNGTDQK